MMGTEMFKQKITKETKRESALTAPTDRSGKPSFSLFPFVRILLLVSVLLSFGIPHSTFGITNYPSWWTSRNVINTNATTNDYAAVNAGQLKWFATNAYEELKANLPGGAGANVENTVKSFSATNNYYAVNLGQLKNLASNFYVRLIAEGYTNTYPWTSTTTTDDVDYAAANIGQIKNVFSFDLTKDTDGDGLANWVETGTGIYVSPYDTGTSPTNSDSDGDGINDGAEVDIRTDPNNSDTNKPTVVIKYPANNSEQVRIP